MTHFVLQNMLICWLNLYFISYGHNEMIFYVMCQFVYNKAHWWHLFHFPQ